MESTAPFPRHRRPSSSDRFLDIFSQSPPPDSAFLGGSGDELSEDDVFWSGGDSVKPNGSPSTSSTSPHSHPRHSHHLSPTSSSSSPGKGFRRADNFGILAALPDYDGKDRTKSSGRSVLNHSASISPSSATATASRMIPVIPRPPPERTFSVSVKCPQSAPVNVPTMMARDDSEWRRRMVASGLNNVGKREEDEEEWEDGVMLPPHEIVARRSENSPVLSCSVLEGAGRTLKGRDLRRVRNAVFRQTGFID